MVVLWPLPDVITYLLPKTWHVPSDSEEVISCFLLFLFIHSSCDLYLACADAKMRFVSGEAWKMSANICLSKALKAPSEREPDLISFFSFVHFPYFVICATLVAIILLVASNEAMGVSIVRAWSLSRNRPPSTYSAPAIAKMNSAIGFCFLCSSNNFFVPYNCSETLVAQTRSRHRVERWHYNCTYILFEYILSSFRDKANNLLFFELAFPK